MKKENDILSNDFLDFEVFVLPHKNSALFDQNNFANASILVAYNNEKNDPELEDLLKNILVAAKLDFEKEIIPLKTTFEQKYSFNQIKEKINVKDILFFGLKPANFGLNYFLEPYQPLQVNGLRILLVNDLEDIRSDVKKKKALWSCLKEMYLQNQSE